MAGKDWINRWESVKNNSKIINALFKTLKSHKPKSLHESAQQLHNEVFEEIDCLECANCCHSIPPIVSSRDTKRIAGFLGISKQKFGDDYLATDDDGDTVINASPCPFLEPDNRCRIYEVRPNACRQYPHSGDYQFVQNIQLHRQNIQYCPALFTIIKRISAGLNEDLK